MKKKIARDITLVFHSSTITMMHGPISIKALNKIFVLTTWVSDDSEENTANISLQRTGRSSCQDRKCIFCDAEP